MAENKTWNQYGGAMLGAGASRLPLPNVRPAEYQTEEDDCDALTEQGFVEGVDSRNQI